MYLMGVKALDAHGHTELPLSQWPLGSCPLNLKNGIYNKEKMDSGRSLVLDL